MKKILIFIVIFVVSISGTSAYTQSQLDAANILALEWIILDSSVEPSGYNLDKNVLRQEIAAVAVGVADIERSFECLERFSDVSARNPNTWICRNVEPLLEAGIVAPNDTFRPEDSITKAEGLGMLVKAACGDNYAFDSGKSGSWQGQLVTYATANTIVDPFTDYNTPATRGWVFEVGVKARNACGKDKNTKKDGLSLQNGDVVAIITTNMGTIKLKLFTDKVPKTTANFIGLSKNDYYDGIIFHRVIPDFMIQGGDPEGTGAGGESIYGEAFEDEFHPELTNIRGTISMANAGQHTNGSQFFINVVDNNFLDNIHTVFGQVVEGMDVVDKISKLKTTKNDVPISEIKIISSVIEQYQDGKYVEYDFDLDAVLEKVVVDGVPLKEVNKDRAVVETDTVSVHYRGILEDGREFDSSYDRGEPIEVDIDAGQVIPGFANALIGMKIGEMKSVTLAPADAYGEHDETKTQDVPLIDFIAQGVTPVAGGTVLSMMGELKVIAVTEDAVTLDLNHPLAGKNLIFDLELIGFVD